MKVKFTKTTVSTLAPGLHWDTEIQGFGCRVSPKGKRVLIVQFRTVRGESKRLAIGAFPLFTVEQARISAREILRAAAAGKDPALEKQARKTAITMAELGDKYIEEYLVKLEGGSFRNARTAFNHIRPLIGSVSVMDMDDAKLRRALSAINDVGDLQRGKFRGRFNAIVSYVRSAWNWGVKNIEGFPKSSAVLNPTMGFEIQPKGTRKRAVSIEDYRKIQSALQAVRKNSRMDPVKILAVEMAMFCGARPLDVRRMKWEDVKENGVVLPFHKTARWNGAKVVMINAPARDVLARAEAYRIDGNPYIFPDLLRRVGMCGRLNDVWNAVKKESGLHDMVLYNLRSGFASIGEEAGVSVETMAPLLGHQTSKTTERWYKSTHEKRLVAANNAIGELLKPVHRGHEPEPEPEPESEIEMLRRRIAELEAAGEQRGAAQAGNNVVPLRRAG